MNKVYESLNQFIVNSFKNYSDCYVNTYGGKCKCVTFIVTRQCSLRCTYCYETHKEDKRMSWETAKQCVDFLFEQDKNESIYINEKDSHGIVLDFIGGEPLLEIRLIQQIYEYFLEKAIALNHRWKTQHLVSMSSNGVNLFEPEVLEFLSKYKEKVSINITVDGNKELHDKCRLFPDGSPSYDLAIKAALYCKEIYGPPPTKITLAPENITHLFEAVKSLIEILEPTYLHGNPAFEEGWKPEHATIYYTQLKMLADWIIDNEIYKQTFVTFFDNFMGYHLEDSETNNWCGGTGEMLAFDIDGVIYPCVRYAPISVGQELAKPMQLGHVDCGFLCNETQCNCSKMLSEITRQSQSTQECLDCPINAGCAWCSAYNYQVNGTPNSRVTYICELHKARCLANSYYWNRLAIKFGIKQRLPINVPRDWALKIIPESEYNYLIDLAKIPE